MKRIYIVGIILFLIQSKNFGQMVQVDNNALVIVRAFDKNNKITVADTTWEKLAWLTHTGDDFKVESFAVSFVGGSQVYTFDQAGCRIQDHAIKKALETKTEKIYVEKIKITGLGKTIYAQFIVNIQFTR